MIPEHAVQAYAELDGQIFQGRLLHLIPSREKRVVEAPEGSSYKSKQAQKLKSQAKDETSWNSLFMSPDAVADSMANKLNVAKSDILDVHADNMAVWQKKPLRSRNVTLPQARSARGGTVQSCHESTEARSVKAAIA